MRLRITPVRVMPGALVLGLTLVALQVSSTQYSPRVLRNFLRDRPNQVFLSVIVATFAYSADGLYAVVTSPGTPAAPYPQLAVTVAIVLLFASLGGADLLPGPPGPLDPDRPADGGHPAPSAA